MGNKATQTRQPQRLGQDEIDPVKRKKNDRKGIECEVLGLGDEAAESAAAWTGCWKNPDHVSFIPAPDFNLDHLPPEYRETPVLDFITAISALTVRLRVDYVTRKRPKGYAFAENRGSRVPHVGTGHVRAVSVGEGPCPCRACSRFKSPPPTLQEWFQVRVASACHVLYNSEEAMYTRVDFFYDQENSRSEGKATSLWGVEVFRKDRKSDECYFTCVTHDEALAKQLQDLLERFQATKKALPETIPSEGIVVIVSHPHGQPKKVTVGKLVEYQVNWAEPRAYALTYTLVYDADTCAGSSGAPVFEVSSDSRKKVYSSGTFHSGFKTMGNHSISTMHRTEPLDPCTLM